MFYKKKALLVLLASTAISVTVAFEHSKSRLPNVKSIRSKHNGVPVSPIYINGGASSLQASNENTPPPSQIESVVNNAKSLNPFGAKLDRDATVSSIAAGLAVSLAMVPEAISFSYVAGVSPLKGLWSTVFLGFFAALFGGR